MGAEGGERVVWAVLKTDMHVLIQTPIHSSVW